MGICERYCYGGSIVWGDMDQIRVDLSPSRDTIWIVIEDVDLDGGQRRLELDRESVPLAVIRDKKSDEMPMKKAVASCFRRGVMAGMCGEIDFAEDDGESESKSESESESESE